MQEGDIDIVELIIKNMPEQTELQSRIKFYMEAHRSQCNYFIYSKYQRETTFFNTILKSLRSDLGAEIARTFVEKNML